MENQNNPTGVMRGILMGTLIGGVLGLLFAPHEGSKTRKLLTQKAIDGIKDAQISLEYKALEAQDSVDSLKAKGENLKNKVTNDISEKSEEVLDKVNTIEQDISSKAGKVVSQIHNQTDNLRSKLADSLEDVKIKIDVDTDQVDKKVRK